MNKHKILVVDDDPKLSRLVKTILEKTTLYEVQEENRSSPLTYDISQSEITSE